MPRFIPRRPQVLRKGKTDASDQYFTTKEDAAECWRFLHEEAPIAPDAHYVDPCAGAGAFLRLMPEGRRSGFDIAIQPGMDEISRRDFLLLDPLEAPLPPGFVAVSNPPFGFRGSMAVAFVNKCFELGASYVGFIQPACLVPDYDGPPIFERRLPLCHSIAHWRPISFFNLPDGGQHKVVNCGFVVYQRGGRPREEIGPTCDSFFKLYACGTYPHHPLSRRGPIERCDYFVRASRFITEKRPVLIKKPDREARWIGIEILRPEARAVIEGLDWDNMGRYGAMRNICICARHIRAAAVEAGLVDDGVVVPPAPRPADPGFDLI